MGNMSLANIIMELGGIGAVVSLVTNLIQGYRTAILDQQQFQRDQARQDHELEHRDNMAKIQALISTDIGAWVHRILVVSALLIISATVWGPLFFADVSVTWYWPTEGGFFSFDFDKIKPFTVGSKEAARQIAILPIHIAMMSNILAFYLINRPFKRRY